MKTVAAVIVGYLVMFVCVFVLLTAAWFALGPSGAFVGNTFNVSTTWIGTSIVAGLLAAYLGAKVAMAIEGTSAAWWLAGVAFVFGLMMAFPTLGATADLGSRPSDISIGDAMMKARTPAWVAFLNPFLATAGVWLATRGRKPGSESEA